MDWSGHQRCRCALFMALISIVTAGRVRANESMPAGTANDAPSSTQTDQQGNQRGDPQSAPPPPPAPPASGQPAAPPAAERHALATSSVPPGPPAPEHHPVAAAPQFSRFMPVMVSGEHPQAHYSLEPVDPWIPRQTGPCVGGCIYTLMPAEYRLSVTGPGLVEGSRKIELLEPSRVYVEPRTQGQRTTGLVIAIIGTAAAATGFLLLSAADSLDSNDTRDNAQLTGLLLLVGGAIMTPIGWVKFGRSAPRTEIVPW